MQLNKFVFDHNMRHSNLSKHSLNFSMNRDSYNRIASQWDEFRKEVYGREQDYLDLLLSDLPNHALVLDLGCGTGRPMAEYVISKGHGVLGIEQAEELIKLAKKRFPDEQWILSPIEQYDFNNDFHAVIIWDSLFHIDRSRHAIILRNVVEKLPGGGKIMLTVGGSAHPAFTDTMFGQAFFYDSNTPEDTNHILRSLGCQILVGEFMNFPTKGRDKGRYAIVAQKVDRQQTENKFNAVQKQEFI